MEPCLLRAGHSRLSLACLRSSGSSAAAPLSRQQNPQQCRRLVTITRSKEPDFRAAAPISFTDRPNRRPSGGRGRSSSRTDDATNSLMKEIRVVPASPSYFTGTPRYTDDVLSLAVLLRRYQLLPRVPMAEATRVAWKKLSEYRIELAEPVRVKGYGILLSLLKRMNCIHPSVMPEEVVTALNKYKRQVQPHDNPAKPIPIDSWGRAKGIGRRKSSSAMVYLVEGQGECFVNGRTIADYFSRIHDRESAVWALKATSRLDKYNVWAKVEGGGTTGQAEAITLGLAKALLAHEPALKPALRKAGVVSRDPRRVERKKPGKLKARKMPAWVKR
ncbi:uncharacterized protein K489DRAFT_344049 [Dissoconium aciculare CBS 342.82]|uniref:Small ribosomal subunit protein uS9m n=1 Tax=Dissoconium aciculare CBS 342.82 TaxID=1314786 RepID=A0A6J3LVX7_9PEZI|nr:uncharacterized protein K489DRAFT_344049 [Dissoconium aciculare CBS 342.82]KAF1819920.1 hypothetical protein K489DRAFT_344049 [Dissoconium aciculare CBS 342.82]